MACDLIRGTNAELLSVATPSMFQTTIRDYEEPTPTNLSRDEKEMFEQDRPSEKEYLQAKKYASYSVYQLRKESLSLAGRALDLLHRGNQKPVFDPRSKTDIETLFPEYASFKGLAKVATAGAYVAFAEGRSKQGTQYLCDSIILGQNLSDGVLISRLVGVAIQAIALASFERHLPSISLQDAAMVEALAPKLLTSPPAAVKTMIKEFEFMEHSLETLFDQKEGMEGWSMGLDDEEQSVAEKSAETFIAKLSPAEKRQVISICKQKMIRHREVVLAMYRKPESTWEDGIDEESIDFPEGRPVGSVNDLAEYLSSAFTPVFSQVGSVEIKNRTQIRLLALVGSVIRFRWEHGRWPNKLAEAVGDKGIFDPANNDEFQYEIQGNGFRVYSKGTKSLGEIALKYRRQTSGEDNQPPPS